MSPLPPTTLPADSLLGLVSELGTVLLLLASATAGLLALRVGWRRRALRVRARRWARRPWLHSDAAIVVGLAAALLSSAVLPAWAGESTPVSGTPGLTQLILALATQPCAAFLLCLHRSAAAGRTVSEVVGIRWRRGWRHASKGLFGGLAILLPALVISWVSGVALLHWNITPEPQEALRWLSEPDTPLSVRLVLLAHSIVVAPMVEELLYRGVLLSVLLRTRRTFVAVLLVSVFFAALHFQAQVFLPLLFVGASLALGLLSTGSLVTPIVMHMVFNAGNILLLAAGSQ